MSESPRRTPGTLQLHVTLRCNLRCLHCYSSSGPELREELPPDLACGAATDAAALGYGLVSISGGEPLLYRPLPEVLAEARRSGLATALVTNGMLLDRRRLAPLRDCASLVVVSLDGRPAAHDRMRARPGAFAALLEGLPALRDSGIPFAFLFTLTRASIDDLDWVADFAAASGATALQVHPIGAAGRAAERPDAPELAVPDLDLAWEAGRRAAAARDRHGGRLRIIVDFLPARLAPSGREPRPGEPFAAIASTLVVEADGTVVPVAHGFARAHALGRLQEARLPALAERWVAAGGASRFLAVVRRVAEAAARPDAPPLLRWTEEVGRAAAAPPSAVPAEG